MGKLRSVLGLAILLAIPNLLAAGEGPEAAEALEKTVSLEGLTGISWFFARTYNENVWLYAVCCTGMMAVVGMAIAFGMSRLLKAVGLEVHKIEHKE